MILFIEAKLKDIFIEKRDYPWPRPEVCPCCGQSRVWGHGFVKAYFDGFKEALVLRRYRCPYCFRVFRVRPKGYLPRFWSPVVRICASIRERMKGKGYLPGLSRTRQRHWFKALYRNVMLYLGNDWTGRLVEGFFRLLSKGRIGVSRGMQWGKGF